MSTTRPEASVITGTFREMSGSTTPVATNSDDAWYAAAVTIGILLGMLHREEGDVHARNHFGGRRRLRRRICVGCAAAKD
jgi:hypothetical protein